MTTRSSIQLAADLGWGFAPTAEQANIIEFDGDEPALVVAGAGSGKTETMAQRVVWLVANGRARPSEILGLTFTRKATAGLSQRINSSLARLASTQPTGPHDEAIFDAPTISTYNAFAHRLFEENALRVGYEPESILLTEAGAWQLAYSLVTASTDQRLASLGKSPSAVTSLVLDLAHDLTDHLVDTERLAGFPEKFLALCELPGKKLPKAIESRLRSVEALPVLLDLAAAYTRAKQERALIEFSDQVRLALEAVTRAPSVVAEHRGRYRYILLDEYQDTSVSQTRLLAELFRGKPVMAVGDPNQSIYGWRGAAAGNLARFTRAFAADGQSTDRFFTLSTSWRNDATILDVANAAAHPLAATSASATAAPVITLRARPQAGHGSVEYFEQPTLEDEAEHVAALIAADIAEHPDQPEIAVLFRTRKNMAHFADALHRHGIPHQIVGLGGVLDSPEVVDLRCALAVVSSANAGNELIRLLTGSRWRIGTKDIVALHAHARYLAHVEAVREAGDRAVASVTSVSDDDTVTIIDALDHLRTVREGSVQLEKFSQAGAERLRDAAAVFARLRRSAGRSLRDLALLAEHELFLDVEVIANPKNHAPRRNLDVFHAKVAEYELTVASSTLGGLVTWLDRVASDENVAPVSVRPEPGTVQLLTAHAAKGLEWDLVVIPRFVDGEYPSASNDGYGWLHVGDLPNEFRGDRDDIPQLSWRTSTDTAEFRERLAEYDTDEREHHRAEERRILYVALTRARRRLVLTASLHSSTRKNPFAVSPFLAELLPHLTSCDTAAAGDADAPPPREPRTQVWPRDPLGDRRQAMVEAAARVEAASARDNSLGDAGRYAADIELLLAERRAALAGAQALVLPHTVSASRLVSVVADPVTALRNIRRPIPAQPSGAAALGTAFHAWVEQRYSAPGPDPIVGVAGYGDTVGPSDGLAAGPRVDLDTDEGLAAAYSAVDLEKLAHLQRTFLASDWAGRKPVDVEVAITAVIADTYIACKLDAVFPTESGGYEIVDWKTGAPPRDARDRADKEIQLAVYRHAYAAWKGVDPDAIRTAFYYVAHDTVLRPEKPLSAQQLADVITSLQTTDVTP